MYGFSDYCVNCVRFGLTIDCSRVRLSVEGVYPLLGAALFFLYSIDEIKRGIVSVVAIYKYY